jgi:glucose-1-phosphate cytidylyltransferase
VSEHRVLAYPYDGFWAPMDTLKDKQTLEGLVASGQAPWSTPVGLGRAEAPDDA